MSQIPLPPASPSFVLFPILCSLVDQSFGLLARLGLLTFGVAPTFFSYFSFSFWNGCSTPAQILVSEFWINFSASKNKNWLILFCLISTLRSCKVNLSPNNVFSSTKCSSANTSAHRCTITDSKNGDVTTP